jgi:hypothetical protein
MLEECSFSLPSAQRKGADNTDPSLPKPHALGQEWQFVDQIFSKSSLD